MRRRARGRTQSRVWPLDSRLSKREGCVAILIYQGLSNSEIAHKLHISTSTAKTHVRNIFNKLYLDSRVELAGYVGFLVGRIVGRKYALRNRKE